MSYSDLPVSFQGHALETTAYSLNLVPSKSVPTTPTELWTGKKPSLRHVRIQGSPAHVLKRNTDKLESRKEVYFFIGYPRGTKGSLFYSPKDHKVIVSTDTTFLEEDYVMDHKPGSQICNTLYFPTMLTCIYPNKTSVCDLTLYVDPMQCTFENLTLDENHAIILCSSNRFFHHQSILL